MFALSLMGFGMSTFCRDKHIFHPWFGFEQWRNIHVDGNGNINHVYDNYILGYCSGISTYMGATSIYISSIPFFVGQWYHELVRTNEYTLCKQSVWLIIHVQLSNIHTWIRESDIFHLIFNVGWSGH